MFGIEKTNLINQVRISLESEFSDGEEVPGIWKELWIVEEDEQWKEWKFICFSFNDQVVNLNHVMKFSDFVDIFGMEHDKIWWTEMIMCLHQILSTIQLVPQNVKQKLPIQLKVE